MKQVSMKRAVRKRQIHDAIFRIGQERGVLNVSLYTIAKALDMWPSPHLRGIVSEMVRDGELIESDMPHRPNVTKKMYALPMDEAFGEVETKSNIVIKLKGKVV